MGMISEIEAGKRAEKLEGILIEAAGEGGEAKEFAKKHLYPWYLDECLDSFGCHNTDKEVISEYE
jgi:hypothetical protein